MSDTSPSAPPRRRLTRSTSDRVIGGVCGGLGEHFAIDPVIFRVGFVVFTLAGGSGLLLYLALWLFVPEDDGVEAIGQRVTGASFAKVAVIALIVLIGLQLVGSIISWMVTPDLMPGPFVGAGRFYNPAPQTIVMSALIVLVIVAVLVGVLRSSRGSTGFIRVPPPPTPPQPDDHGGDAPGRPSAAEPPAVPGVGSPPVPPAPPVVPRAPRPPSAPRPPRARRGGPSITRIVLSALLVIIGLGALLSWSTQAVVALALLACGVGLLVGARFGRARGLIPVGVILTLVLAAVVSLDARFGGGVGTKVFRPTSDVDVADRYEWLLGEVTLDLSEVAFDASRDISASLLAGDLTVIVPRDVHVVADARVGAGELGGPGISEQGNRIRLNMTAGDDTSRVQLHLDLDVGAGRLVLRESAVYSTATAADPEGASS